MLRKFLLVVPIIALCTACSSTSKAPIEETTESLYSYSERDEIATSLEEAIYAELDKETISFLATTTDSLRIYIDAEDHVSFDIRVAICPDAIPFVAEHISPVALSIIQEQGYSDIRIQYNFYSENNIDGIEKNSFIMWMTNDGEAGTLVTPEALYSMTLDEVYSYFNDFMKEYPEIDKNDITIFQGEWKGEHSDFIISGCNVYSIHYGILDKSDMVTKIYTFHFEYDENGQLVVCNQYSQPRYILSIADSGELKRISTIGDNEEIFYTFVSDNTTLPHIKPEPYIGMTTDEVIDSTWGTPIKKNITKTSNSISEQWVYEKGYIYIDNGVVTAIQY